MTIGVGIRGKVRIAVSLLSAVAFAQPNPGATRKGTLADACTAGVSTAVRREHPVSARTRQRILTQYGLPATAKGYVIDHIIPLELLGANTENNEQPQTLAESQRKDRLENRLHKLVCGGQLELGEAQREIAGDWQAAYQRYVVQKGK